MTLTRPIAPAEVAQGTLRLGSLFSGAGWLDLAIEESFGGVETAFVCDIEPGPCKVLAHRFPDVPNLGDITKVAWPLVRDGFGPIDIIAGGSPCQDISTAGRVAGMVEGSRSNLWVEMREAIRVLAPMFVVWENVGAARSTKAASRFHPEHIDRAIAHHLTVKDTTRDPQVHTRHRRAAHRLMESRARRVGVAYPKPSLRALGRVLGDLATLGFDAELIALRAADVGAPHGRLRYFVLAADTRGQAWLQRTGLRPGEPERVGRGRPDNDGREAEPVALLPTPQANLGEHNRANGQDPAVRRAQGRQVSLADVTRYELLPTPTTQDAANTAGPSQLDRNTPPLNTVVTLLPTPSAGNFNDGEDPVQWEERRQRVKETAGNGNGMGMPLGVAVQLLPTPRATDGEKGGPNQRGSSGDLMLPSAVAMLPTPRATRGGSSTETVDLLLPTPSVADATGGHERSGGNRSDELLLKGIAAEQAWGPYEPAIRRWESIVGAAPAPTKPGKKGRPKLNPAFAEWMMGAAPGWITDVPGVTDNEALRMAGNGVVQQQAVAALHLLMARMAAWGEESAA